MSLRNELMCLFQKCHKVQAALLKLLNEKLSFDCSFQNELQLLVDGKLKLMYVCLLVLKCLIFISDDGDK